MVGLRGAVRGSQSLSEAGSPAQGLATPLALFPSLEYVITYSTDSHREMELGKVFAVIKQRVHTHKTGKLLCGSHMTSEAASRRPLGAEQGNLLDGGEKGGRETTP